MTNKSIEGARRCVVRRFRLMDMDNQHLSCATPDMLKWEKEDVNYEYIRMIEEAPALAEIERLKGENEKLQAGFPSNVVATANERLKQERLEAVRESNRLKQQITELKQELERKTK